MRHAVGNDQARLQRAARQDGTTNAEAEADKADRYPAHRSPYKALPLALETFGRHGRSALRYLRKLARAHAAKVEGASADATSALVARWGRWLSVALHRATARNLRAALGEDRAKGAVDLVAALGD